MKKIIFISVIFLLLNNYTKSQIQVDDNGNVGIGEFLGGTPQHTLQVNGHTYLSCQPATSGLYFTNDGVYPAISPQWGNSARLGTSSSNQFWKIYSRYIYMNGSLVLTSDIKTKNNIRKINGSLSKIVKLKPIKYDFKHSSDDNSPKEMKERINKANKDQVGFVAQEMAKVIPEIVLYDEDSKLYGIDYIKLTPYLVDAITEQQAIIQNLEKEIEEIKNNCCKSNESKSQLKTATKINSELNNNSSSNKLFQNNPNPFTESTQINYFLANDANKASINIYDMTGAQLKSYNLTAKGQGKIVINGGELRTGMFIYALIVDGQLIDSKQMILTHN